MILDVEAAVRLACGLNRGFVERKSFAAGVVLHRSAYAVDRGEVVAVGRGYLRVGNPEGVLGLCPRLLRQGKLGDEQRDYGRVGVPKYILFHDSVVSP